MSRYQSRPVRAACLLLAVCCFSAAGAGARYSAAEAQRLPRINVIVVADGVEHRISTSRTAVAGILQEAGITLGKLDRVVPGPLDRVRDGARIVVTRIKEEVVSETAAVPFETVRTFTAALRPGIVRQVREGADGQKMLLSRVRYVDGKEVSRSQISSVVVRRPVDRVLAIGSRGRYTSRGEWRTRRILEMSASAYDPGPRSCGKYASGRTACGLRAGYGVVAVDPRVIPMGTKLYIEGYGHAIAGDRGRAIKGNRIDLGFNTYREAIQFGRRTVTVHILEE